MVLVGKTETPPLGEYVFRRSELWGAGWGEDVWSGLYGWTAGAAGMLMLAAVRRFEGMVMVLHHASTIQPKYQAMMHCGAIRVSLPA
jgi:hypothetical protein